MTNFDKVINLSSLFFGEIKRLLAKQACSKTKQSFVQQTFFAFLVNKALLYLLIIKTKFLLANRKHIVQ